MTLDDRLTKAKGIILSPDDGTWSYMTDTTQDKKAILSDLLELIGEDDTEVRGTTQNSTNPKYWTKRTKTKNELRQELRNKLKEYFGIKE